MPAKCSGKVISSSVAISERFVAVNKVLKIVFRSISADLLGMSDRVRKSRSKSSKGRSRRSTESRTTKSSRNLSKTSKTGKSSEYSRSTSKSTGTQVRTSTSTRGTAGPDKQSSGISATAKRKKSKTASAKRGPQSGKSAKNQKIKRQRQQRGKKSGKSAGKRKSRGGMKKETKSESKEGKSKSKASNQSRRRRSKSRSTKRRLLASRRRHKDEKLPMICSYWRRAASKRNAHQLIIIIRSAERVDRVFGAEWLKTEAPHGHIVPTDLNIPNNSIFKKLLNEGLLDENPPVTAFGKYNTQLTGRALFNRGVSSKLLICSPTLRSIQTGESLAKFLDAKLAIEPGLFEPLAWYRNTHKVLPNFHIEELAKIYPIDTS
ncbi:hypothetical protein GCK32_015803 [Trichostrongylus colubriformis]|uniref:Uncharacterized protein n=1 Tax=Trichostrongylus colubriformis TaxID=6319 RepID=A0AAN8G8X7_TRICO